MGLFQGALLERQTARVITACPNEEFPEHLGGGLAKFYDLRTGFVKFVRKRIAAADVASDNIFKKPDAAWAKVKEAISVSQRQGCGEVTALQDLRMEDQGQHLQAAFGCQDKVGRCCVRSPGLVGSDRGHEQAQHERMKVMNRVNRAMKVLHDKLKESLVDTGVHDALAKFFAHDISLAKHARSRRTI